MIGLESDSSLLLIFTQKPQNDLFFVAAVSAGVDADCGKLSFFTPALDREGRNTEKFGNFSDGHKIW